MTYRRKLAGLAAAAVALAAVPVTLGASGGGPSSPPPVLRAPARPRPRVVHNRVTLRPVARPTATVTVEGPIQRVPPSFLGLSIEYWGLPLFEAHMGAFSRMLSLLHPPGGGPLIVRVGGDSADRSLWDPGTRRLPQWVFRLAPRWLQSTHRLLAVDPVVRLILDLNLITASPLRAVAWARAAQLTLGAKHIVAFEIGNEPDIYDRPYWLATIARTGTTVLPAAISARSYVRDFIAYARALRRSAPSVPLIGPAVATPVRSLGWISLLARRGRPWLRELSAHRYPLSACLGPGSSSSPTIPRLLSERVSAGLAPALRPAVAVAHRAGLPLRITELNSVTCGGRAGVSNTFATALWAPDALFELLRTGVDGVNIHVRADAANAAMVPVRGGVLARPLLYGLILFTRTIAGAQALLHPALAGHHPPGFKAWAVSFAGGTRVLLINKSIRSVTVAVRIPTAVGAATVQRLRAPRASSISGETLGGRWLARTGRWQGALTEQLVPESPGGYAVTVPALSAALVTVR